MNSSLIHSFPKASASRSLLYFQESKKRCWFPHGLSKTILAHTKCSCLTLHAFSNTSSFWFRSTVETVRIFWYWTWTFFASHQIKQSCNLTSNPLPITSRFFVSLWLQTPNESSIQQAPVSSTAVTSWWALQHLGFWSCTGISQAWNFVNLIGKKKSKKREVKLLEMKPEFMRWKQNSWGETRCKPVGVTTLLSHKRKAHGHLMLLRCPMKYNPRFPLRWGNFSTQHKTG